MPKELFSIVRPDPLNIAVRSHPQIIDTVLTDRFITQQIRQHSSAGNWQQAIESLNDRAVSDRKLAKLIESVRKESER